MSHFKGSVYPPSPVVTLHLCLARETLVQTSVDLKQITIAWDFGTTAEVLEHIGTEHTNVISPVDALERGDRVNLIPKRWGNVDLAPIEDFPAWGICTFSVSWS